MRVVTSPEAFGEALDAAKREALAAFGDDAVLLERYLSDPRHIEFQILADAHGTTIHLGERECSIQRRHQKIVEEAPSVALTPELRSAMGSAAVRAAKSVGYVNAGTCEFMLDADGKYYFLEMNARLQVEHPVTELVYGIDLVQWQLRIASGERLTIAQDDVRPRGWAIEGRIYAEDPANHMLPSIGTISHWSPPAGPGVRLDSGVTAGSEVSLYYDPMLAKLIVYGTDRPNAVARFEEALEEFPSTAFARICRCCCGSHATMRFAEARRRRVSWRSGSTSRRSRPRPHRATRCWCVRPRYCSTAKRRGASPALAFRCDSRSPGVPSRH